MGSYFNSKKEFKELSSGEKVTPDIEELRAHDCKYRESLARLKKSKILIICQKNPLGELSLKEYFQLSRIDSFRENEEKRK